MPPSKNIWAHSFLQEAACSDDDDDDDSPGTDDDALDAGKLERQQLEQLDLSARDEGSLVVKHNPWTKAKEAAGSRSHLESSSSAAASSDSSSSSGSKGARPVAPSSNAALKPAPLPIATGSVHGRNGWWRPPPSASRPATSKPGSADLGERTRKRKVPPAALAEEGPVAAADNDEVIDLTARPLASRSDATQDLLRRLKRRRSLKQEPLEKSDVPTLAEDISSGSVSPPPTSADPPTLKLAADAPVLAHILDLQDVPCSFDAAYGPALVPAGPSSEEVIQVDSSSSSSSPSPEAGTTEGRLGSAVEAAQHASALRSAPHRPPSLPVNKQAIALVATAKRKASPGSDGRISFSKIPRDAGPTAEYPILQGLDLQRRKAPSQPPPPPVAKRVKRSEPVFGG